MTDHRRRHRISLLVVAIAAGLMLLWLVLPIPRGEVLFQETFSKTIVLTIRCTSVKSGDGGSLQLSYHKSPAMPYFGTTIMDSLQISADPLMLQFGSIRDQELHLRCVYDLNGHGLLVLFDETTEDLWVTGRQFGWHGSPRSHWQTCLDRLRTKHDIPYETLPTIR